MQNHPHREQADHIRDMLIEELQTLELLEKKIKGHPLHDVRNRVRLDEVTAAINLLQRAVAALDLATCV